MHSAILEAYGNRSIHANHVDMAKCSPDRMTQASSPYLGVRMWLDDLRRPDRSSHIKDVSTETSTEIHDMGDLQSH